MTADRRPQIDENIPRFNQGMVALLSGFAFVLQWWPLVAGVLAVVAVTRVGGHRLGLFSQIYQRVIAPLRQAPLRTEWAAPPRFSQTLSVVFLAAATGLLAGGLEVAGWTVTLMVTALAFLAAAARVCVGCVLYRRLVDR